MTVNKKVAVENKFYLKNWFKNNTSTNYAYNQVALDSLSKKVNNSIITIQKNGKKIGCMGDKLYKSKSSEDIYNECCTYWNQHKTFKGLESKKLKDLLSILFANPNEGVPYGLYDKKEQFNNYINTLIDKNKQLLLKRVISELLYSYPKTSPDLFNRLSLIYNALDKNKRSNQILHQANKTFKILEKEGSFIIAKEILNLNNNIDDLLQGLWIKERHLSNGIGNDILKHLCTLTKPYIEKQDHTILNRFLNYLISNNKSNEPIKRYNDIKPIVSTLLLPFENKNPQTIFEKTITLFLDKNIGDPRFHSEKWIALLKEKDIFLKWKIGSTIKDFFALLDFTAVKDSDAKRMWRYRKEFINSYLKEGYIKAAWIVLGKEADRHKEKFLKHKTHQYGILTQGGNAMHSVLLLKIGNLTLSEWNYNGKVRIWKGGNKYAPKFYKEDYFREELTKKSNKEIIHHHADIYRWQQKLSDYIKKYTGILCPENVRTKIDKFY